MKSMKIMRYSPYQLVDSFHQQQPSFFVRFFMELDQDFLNIPMTGEDGSKKTVLVGNYRDFFWFFEILES